MAGLSTEWAPGGLVTPGARPFVNSVDELAMVGVRFSTEQLQLLEVGSVHRPDYYNRLLALTIYQMPDINMPEGEALGHPTLTMDEHGAVAPVLVPSIAEIDCSLWQQMDEDDLHWRRYPTLLGRVHVWSHELGFHQEGIEPIRLWNLWPLHDWSEGDLIEHATTNWIKDHWEPYVAWVATRDNADFFPCDYEGTPEHMHDHSVDEYGHVLGCRQAGLWFEHYTKTEMVELEDDGGDIRERFIRKPFPPVGGLYDMTDTWTTLLASSEVNTHRGLAAYPHWDQAEVARTERYYSPWLWSS